MADIAEAAEKKLKSRIRKLKKCNKDEEENLSLSVYLLKILKSKKTSLCYTPVQMETSFMQNTLILKVKSLPKWTSVKKI